MSTNGSNKKIRVLLVDDSPIATTSLQKILSQAPDIEVAGIARDGAEALKLIPEVDPTVVCTDLYMPVMDGLELTQEIMKRFPRPILVVSVSVQTESPRNVFKLLEAGAVDVFQKPRIGLDPQDRELARRLIHEIRVLSGVVVFTRHRVPPPKGARPAAVPKIAPGRLRIVAIGASTGGPQALQTVFSRIPATFPLPILCVQHIGQGFLPGLVEWLSEQCDLQVKIAEEGEMPTSGVVYFAPEETHLEITGHGTLRFNEDASLNRHLPSADVTFNSIAGRYGKSALGILLTGMGDDGAAGMLAIAEAGGITIAQDEETSVVFGMPASAIARGGVRHILPIDKIPGAMLGAVSET